MDEEEAPPPDSLQDQDTEPLELDEVGDEEEAEADADVDEVEETDLLGEDGDDSNNLDVSDPVSTPVPVPVPVDDVDMEDESEALSIDPIHDDTETRDSTHSNRSSNREKDGEEVEEIDDAESSAQDELVQTAEEDPEPEPNPDEESNERETSDVAAEIEDDDDVQEISVPNKSSHIQSGEDKGEEPDKESVVDDEAPVTAAGDDDADVDKAAAEPVNSADTDVITLESNEQMESEDEESDMPMIRVKQVGLFAEEDEDEDEEEEAISTVVAPDETQNVMQVGTNKDASPSKSSQPESPISSRPRRAAAQAAACVIREITSQEEQDNKNLRRRNSRDRDGLMDTVVHTAETTSQERHRCHACKKVAASKVVVRQHGHDIFFCTSACFQSFRNPDSSARRPLPCVKCGIIRESNIKSTYYWETMNFCSDLCVGNYQIEIGSRCATCSKKVAWASLGKYCVRFGSDVRQFCSAFCLETYKKNARVCFHCQLDIKKLSNVILANIPAKTTPKEFCSQDCVEMYIEQNLHQTVSRKPNQNSLCTICAALKITYRELVIPTGSYKICSEFCWTKLLETKNVRRPFKCEICTKFINLELRIMTSALYVSTEQKVYGFCSATCKNVYVLKSRQILACTTCKVKKYNYDLIEHIDENASPAFAVCSLNCIPKPSQYILNLRETLTPVATASEMFSKSRQLQSQQASTPTTQSRIRTTIVSNSNSSNNAGEKSRLAIQENPISSSTQIASVSPATNLYTVLSQSSATSMGLMTSFGGDAAGAGGKDNGVIEMTDGSTDALESRVVDVSEEEMNALIMGAESYLVFPPSEPVQQRNKGCLVRPYMMTVGTQFDSEVCDAAALAAGSGSGGVAVAVEESVKDKEKDKKEKYIPIFIPVFIPFPFYALDAPAPIPLPIPIPVPIPLPMLIPAEPKTVTDPRSLPIAPIHPNTSVIPSSQQQQQQQQLQMIPQALTNTGGMLHSGVLPGPMAIDHVGYLDLPNVGESDSFDILNTIPNLEMDLDLGSSHHSAPGNLMSQSGMIGGSSNLGHRGLMRSLVEDLASSGSEMTWSQPSAVNTIPSHPNLSREEYALRVWTKHFGQQADPVCLADKTLNDKLVELVQKGTYPSGERLPPFMILYICLGLQKYLRTQNRPDKLFYDPAYQTFSEAFVSYAEITYQAGIVESIVEEQHFWEALELGINGPEVVVFTLLYYNYKYFHLRTWQEHSSLQITDYIITTKTCMDGTTYKSLSLRGGHATSQSVDEMALSDKCFIKLFEFYKFKSTISNSGPFYKEIIPRPPLKAKWYGVAPLSQMDIYRMLIRAMMIKG